MKKFFLIIAIILLSIIAPSVNASEADLYCEYVDANDNANGTVLYKMFLHMYSSDNGTENGPLFDYEFLDANDNEVYTELTPYNLDMLEMYRIIRNGKLQCPSLSVKASGEKAGALILWSQEVEGDKRLSVSKIECPDTGCDFKGIPGLAESVTCIYNGPSGTITIEPSGNQQSKVTYPDNTSELRTDVWSVTEAGACSDIFYNKRTKEIEISWRDYKQSFDEISDHYSPSLHEFVCGSDKGNIEYYCAGTCKFPNNKNINCSEIDKQIAGVGNGTNATLNKICAEPGILKAMRFIGYLLYIVKVLVPVILIIMGSIDFGKAVIASNQDAVKKAATTFATRIISGILIFLLPTMVNFVFSLIPSSASDYSNCRTCLFHPGECNIDR